MKVGILGLGLIGGSMARAFANFSLSILSFFLRTNLSCSAWRAVGHTYFGLFVSLPKYLSRSI